MISVEVADEIIPVSPSVASVDVVVLVKEDVVTVVSVADVVV